MGFIFDTDSITPDSGSGGGSAVDQIYDGTSPNAQSGIAIAGANFIKNYSTVTKSISTWTNTSNNYIVAIGYNASCLQSNTLAIGSNAQAYKNYCVCLGPNARTGMSTYNAIQLGSGENSTSYTFNVGFYQYNNVDKNWTLLDGITGKIPNDRINVDNTPTQNSTNFVTSGTIYTALGDIETLINAL